MRIVSNVSGNGRDSQGLCGNGKGRHLNRDETDSRFLGRKSVGSGMPRTG